MCSWIAHRDVIALDRRDRASPSGVNYRVNQCWAGAVPTGLVARETEGEAWLTISNTTCS